MSNEHMGTCIYEEGRFELRETDNAIIDLKRDYPPIMIASDTVDDGSEPNCADTRSVLHLLNELADNNPNEERHWYLKKMLDTAWEQYHEQKEENEKLKSDLDYFKAKNGSLETGMFNLERENEQLKSENEELKKRDNLVLGYLTDEGIITFEKYNEIVDYLYKKWQKKEW